MIENMLGLGFAVTIVTITSGIMIYHHDINREYKRIQGKSQIISSPYGDIEYAEGGAGPNVLVIHGSGGGYDQGELIAQTVLNNQFHWITPSRFGYLRSTFHKGSTFDDQAHAYAHLLDALGIEKVAVVALSHGGPSALLFVLHYPERVSSLTLVSTGVITVSSKNQKQADKQGSMLVTIYEHDWLYWMITKLFKKKFIELMGAKNDIITEITLDQKQLVDRIIDEMNPASLRAAGALFDNHAELPGKRVEGIKAPTLIIHAKDDTLQQFHNAEFTAKIIPEAQLLSFEKGGHLILAIEQATIQLAIQKHIHTHFLEPT
jgi:pimeloyl-ACP methyl ester carboxylesterase